MKSAAAFVRAGLPVDGEREIRALTTWAELSRFGALSKRLGVPAELLMAMDAAAISDLMEVSEAMEAGDK